MADHPYTGRRGAALTPGSPYALDTANYPGNLALSLMPSSQVSIDRVYAGQREALLAPAAVYLLRAPVLYVYVGGRGVELIPDAPKGMPGAAYVGSISHGWIPDLINLETTYEYEGDLSLSLLPNFPIAGLIYPPYVGALGLSLLPNTPKGSLEKTYVGSVTIVFTPAGQTSLSEQIYSGLISLLIRPQSTYSGTVIYQYSGNIPISLLPAVAQTIREAIYSGSIPLSLLPDSLTEGPHVYAYDGKLDLALMPSSAYLLLGIGQYSYDGSLPLILDPSVGTGLLIWTGIPYVPPTPPVKKTHHRRGRLAGEKIKVYGDLKMGDE